MSAESVRAPELQVSQWFNSKTDISLAALRGRVVVLEAFQMLCPACVSHSLPQAQNIHRLFGADDVAVVGIHTVFEHHEAMTPASLRAFLHEYKIEFPVGIDVASEKSDLPKTMAHYQMRGTPSMILLDRLGRNRKHKFGIEQDMIIGAEIMSLVRETPTTNELSLNEITKETSPGSCKALQSP